MQILPVGTLFIVPLLMLACSDAKSSRRCESDQDCFVNESCVSGGCVDRTDTEDVQVEPYCENFSVCATGAGTCCGYQIEIANCVYESCATACAGMDFTGCAACQKTCWDSNDIPVTCQNDMTNLGSCMLVNGCYDMTNFVCASDDCCSQLFTTFR